MPVEAINTNAIEQIRVFTSYSFLDKLQDASCKQMNPNPLVFRSS